MDLAACIPRPVVLVNCVNFSLFALGWLAIVIFIECFCCFHHFYLSNATSKST